MAKRNKALGVLAGEEWKSMCDEWESEKIFCRMLLRE
jgi:hypothetical protein